MTESEKIRAEVKGLYDKIDLCIGELVKGRATHNETLVANAQHKMESLMVQAQQVLSCINDAIEEPVSEGLETAAALYHRNIIDNADDYTIDSVFVADAQWKEQQMMKDTVDAKVLPCNLEETDFCLDVYDEVKAITKLVKENNLKIGEQVKLIIVKED